MQPDLTLAPVLDALLRPVLGYTLEPWPQPLWDRLETLARAANQTPALWLARLLSQPDLRVITQLTAAATITHTAFFRHPDQFMRLEKELRDRRRGPIRILCAACSRGEEAYSLALTAERAGVAFEVDAFDINADAIMHAERGHYDARAARNVPGVDAIRGWTAPAQIRERVRFERCSLAEGLSGRRNATYDYVFCRNVLIYFSPKAAFAVMESLLARVAATGALVVAPTEALAPLPTGLQRGMPMGWLVHARAEAKLITGAPSATAPVSPTSAESPHSLAVNSRERAEQLLTTAMQGQADEEDLTVWLETRPADPVAWFLLGEKFLQRDERTQASVAFTQAITHAAHATLVEPDTLRSAAQRRLQTMRSQPAGGTSRSGDRYAQLPKRK